MIVSRKRSWKSWYKWLQGSKERKETGIQLFIRKHSPALIPKSGIYEICFPIIFMMMWTRSNILWSINWDWSRKALPRYLCLFTGGKTTWIRTLKKLETKELNCCWVSSKSMTKWKWSKDCLIFLSWRSTVRSTTILTTSWTCSNTVLRIETIAMLAKYCVSFLGGKAHFGNC